MATLSDLANFDTGQYIQFGEVGRQRRTLSDIGAAASQGDFQGAQRAAFAGGDVQTGMALRQMNQDQQRQLIQDAASFAYGARTPEQWNAGRQRLVQAYGADADPGEFSEANRQGIINAAMPVADAMKLDLQRQKMAQDRTAQASYGKTPVYGLDANGNMTILQVGSDGSAVQTALPEGVQPLGPYGTAMQREMGKGAGEAQVNLPGAEHNAQRMLYDIDQALNAKGLASAVGPFQGRIPDNMQFNSDTIEARSRIRKLQADTFVQAFESLKGAGQITEYESQSAANALSRLQDTALSDADYRQALLEFKTEVEKLLALARTKAGGAGSAGWSDLGNGVRIRVKE